MDRDLDGWARVKPGLEARESSCRTLLLTSAMRPAAYNVIIIGIGCSQDVQDPLRVGGSSSRGDLQPEHLLEMRRWHIYAMGDVIRGLWGSNLKFCNSQCSSPSIKGALLDQRNSSKKELLLPLCSSKKFIPCLGSPSIAEDWLLHLHVSGSRGTPNIEKE